MDNYYSSRDILDKAIGTDAYFRIKSILTGMKAADVVPVRRAEWKYFHKKNKAVCTYCSFERDLDAYFGRAVACPNCGACMDKEDEHGTD